MGASRWFYFGLSGGARGVITIPANSAESPVEGTSLLLAAAAFSSEPGMFNSKHSSVDLL